MPLIEDRDLSVTLAPGPSELFVDVPRAVTVTVTNDWPVAADGAVVGIDVPANLEVLDGTPEGGSWDETSRQWTLDSVPPYGETKLELRVQAGAAAPASIRAELLAAARPDPDSKPGNDDPSEDDEAEAVFDVVTAHGVLTQKAASAGCVSEDGTAGTCADGSGLAGAFSVTVSPDGTTAYVAASGSDAIAVFDRDAVSGALTQKPGTAGCVSKPGAGDVCDALDAPVSVAISPDGRNAYVAAVDSGAVVTFDRDPSGRLIAAAFLDGPALDGARAVTVSPDGRNVYVAAQGSDAVVVPRPRSRQRRAGAQAGDRRLHL